MKKPKIYPEKNCVECGGTFVAMHPQRKYCGKSCQRSSTLKLRVEVWSKKSVPKQTLGACNELRACADLLLRGYEVFRAVSPACSCDVIALKDGQMLRVEVRTGYRHHSGKTYVDRKGVHDVIAACFKSEIIYEPNLPASEVFDTP